MSPVNRLVIEEARESSIGNSDAQFDAGKYDLKVAVKLPDDQEDRNEWIANNLFDFYKQISMLYGTVSEYCTPEICPKMTAGRKYEYWWSYGPERRSVELCAAKYINHILDWVQEQLDDEDIFPSTSVDKDFASNFIEVSQTIARRLFRVYAHIYYHHLPVVKMLKEEAHMNTSLKHFIYFVKEFELVTQQELDPLRDYIDTLT